MDESVQKCRPLCGGVAAGGAGVLAPAATGWGCISPADCSCGPLQGLPFGGTPFFGLVCQATCLPPETGSCQVIIDGVATGQGTLVLRRIQPAGKRQMTAREFIAGHREFIGARLPS